MLDPYNRSGVTELQIPLAAGVSRSARGERNRPPAEPPVRILAIETSCDETAAAVIDDGRFIRSNIVASQIDLHAAHGGVFPELASRAHVEAIGAVIARAMAEASAAWDSLSAVAVTRGPGLPGSLVVGVNAAKGICLARGLPLIGVNHLEGHLYSHWLETSLSGGRTGWEFPLIGLIVSGGHTELTLMREHGQYELLGHTVDDAAGEAFDKVARLMGLGYPGGPAIERMSQTGNPSAFRFGKPKINPRRRRTGPQSDLPRPYRENALYDFSFSGVKTAALQIVRERSESPSLVPAGGDPLARVPVADLAASFQAAVVDWLVEKALRAAADFSARAILVGGGVSANKLLRQRMALAAEAARLPVSFPPLPLCVDNAAMIGAAAYHAFKRGERNGLDMDVEPELKLGE